MNVMLSKTFFPQHPKAGEPTEFREKVLTGTKRHTCRCNYEYWKTRIETLKKRQGILSLRQWSGKPYQKGSTQEQILDIAASLIDVQQLVMTRRKEEVKIYTEQSPKPFAVTAVYDYEASIDGTPYPVELIAQNDGLTVEDFKAWFNPVFDDEYAQQVTLTKGNEVIEPSELTMVFAVIHFTTFRY